MKVLIFAIESDRWAPARLPEYLGAAQFSVAVLCPPDNILMQTRHLDSVFTLHSVRSRRRMGRDIVAAIRTFGADLIIPADESSVAVLHALVQHIRDAARPLDAPILRVLLVSLCDPLHLDAMLHKSVTQMAAREIGLLTPPGETFATFNKGVALAEQIGFPLYVKQSFSWAGWGVRRCDNRAELDEALQRALARQPGWIKARLRRWLGRSWFRTDAGVDLQKAIDGAPAMYCVAAVDGHVVGGFAGFPRQTAYANGPSTIVELGEHADMAQASAALVSKWNATGLIGFDFMIESATGRAFFLECNARPIQVQHLGGRVGVDLCAALARGLKARASGQTPQREWASGSELVVLFPQEWVRDPASPALRLHYHDVPWDDPKLLEAMLKRVRPRVEATLHAANADALHAAGADALDGAIGSLDAVLEETRRPHEPASLKHNGSKAA